MNEKSLLKPSKGRILQPELDSKLKQRSLPLKDGTGFSDDDDDDFDYYESDFLSGDSSDDSFKDFLKAKEVSSDFKAKSSFSPLSAQTDHFPTKTGNKFLNGLETDNLSLTSKRETLSSAPQARLLEKERNKEFNPLLSLLEDQPIATAEKTDKKSSLAKPVTPKDSSKSKKVGFQSQLTSFYPRSLQSDLQNPKHSELDRDAPNDLLLHSHYDFNKPPGNLSAREPNKAHLVDDAFSESLLHTSPKLQPRTRNNMKESDLKSPQREPDPESFTYPSMKSLKVSRAKETGNEGDKKSTRNTSNHLRSIDASMHSLNTYNKTRNTFNDLERIEPPSVHAGLKHETYDAYLSQRPTKPPRNWKDQEKFESLRSSDKSFDDISSKYVDYLLNERQPDQDFSNQIGLMNDRERPRPKPRKDMDRPKSSTSDQSSKTKTSSLVHPQLKSIENTKSSNESSYTDFLSSLPSLGTSKSETVTSETKKKRSKSPKKVSAVKREKKSSSQMQFAEELENDPSGVSGDDLLALFEQVTVTDRPEVPNTTQGSSLIHDPTRQKTMQMKPSEALAHSIVKQRKNTPVQQKSSRQQLVDNVIDSVAAHNQTYAFTKQYTAKNDEVEKKQKTPKRPGSKKKLVKAKPPENYKGLGSLSALHQLRRSSKNTTDSGDFLSTNDIRSSAYMLWLADREKKMKEKRKLKLEEEEKENEQKQKDKKEKALENESARNAWAQKKEEKIAEEEVTRKIDRKKRREERIRYEEERWKSAKKAEVARERSVIELRKRHQIELKLKREDKMIQEQKDRDKKKANERALEKWDEERGKQWEVEKKRKLRENRAKERAKKELAEKKNEEAKHSFRKWQEKKNRQDYNRYGRITYHEDRPPWCPPNKNHLNA